MIKATLLIPIEINNKLDGFEYHPCKNVGTDMNQEIEQCEEDEAEFWSVYAHYTGSGLECVADVESKGDAIKLSEFLFCLLKYKNN